MYIELKINDAKMDFFLEYLQSFKDGIIENIDIKEEQNPSFMVSNIDEVKKRIKKAEDNADYLSEEEFEKEMDKFVETL
jgi:hypothetical protein